MSDKIKKYRKLPVEVKALKLDLDNPVDVINFFGGTQDYDFRSTYLVIYTLEGNMIAREGDYIIKGVKGEFYPCKPNIFYKIYEEVINE